MTIPKDEFKRNAQFLIDVLREAQKIRVFALSEGASSEGRSEDYMFLDELQQHLEWLDASNWDLKSYFNLIGIKHFEEGFTKFEGWEKQSIKALENLGLDRQ